MVGVCLAQKDTYMENLFPGEPYRCSRDTYLVYPLDTLLISRGLEMSELAIFHYLSMACLSKNCKESSNM